MKYKHDLIFRRHGVSISRRLLTTNTFRVGNRSYFASASSGFAVDNKWKLEIYEIKVCIIKDLVVEAKSREKVRELLISFIVGFLIDNEDKT